MKLFKYDTKELRFVPVTKSYASVVILVLAAFVLMLSLLLSETIYKTVVITEEAKLIVLQEQNQFSEAAFDAYLNSLNIKFPHIVKAQAVIESGHFQSEVFKANNNMFGMKVAKLRPTTSQGENLGHAYYNTWKDCVLDYAFYQAAYLREIKTEEQYYDYLRNNYAEDTNYVNLIKQIVEDNGNK